MAILIDENLEGIQVELAYKNYRKNKMLFKNRSITKVLKLLEI